MLADGQNQSAASLCADFCRSCYSVRHRCPAAVSADLHSDCVCTSPSRSREQALPSPGALASPGVCLFCAGSTDRAGMKGSARFAVPLKTIRLRSRSPDSKANFRPWPSIVSAASSPKSHHSLRFIHPYHHHADARRHRRTRGPGAEAAKNLCSTR